MNPLNAPDMYSSDEPSADPWSAFSYLVAGVACYGALGWFVDHRLGTGYFVAVGILLGAGLGLYMTFKRFGVAARADSTDVTQMKERRR